MKNRTFVKTAVVLGLLAALIVPAAAKVAKDHTKIKSPPLPEFEIPQPEIYTLPNGMTVLLMEDHELPLINVSARIRTGSQYEPADKTGLAGIMAQAQREGGTKNMSGDEIDDYLADRAAFVETGMGGDSGFASMNCLKDDFADVLRVFHDVLRYPVFDEAKIEVAKSQAGAGIARRNDDIGQITGREFNKLIYGEDSPLARNIEYATIAAVTRDDLVAWHKKFYHPNNIMLGIVGDFDSAAIKKTLEETFGGWEKGADFNEPAPAYKAEMEPGVYFIPKEDVTQANIRMGHLGITMKNPDFFNVQVMNEVLGGSFASRLFSNVRSKKGLAYSVFGGVGASFQYPGVCQVGLQTKSETMGEAVDALREEVMGIIDNPPDEEELRRAKDSILNSFVFNYASRQQVLGQQMTYAYHGMAPDFLEQYRANVEKVKPADVARVAKEYVLPGKSVLLVVGKPDDFDRPVSSFGEVKEIDISIPPPPDTGPKVVRSDASLEAGAGLIGAAARKLGGADFASSTAVRSTSKFEVNLGGTKIGMTQKAVIEYPDRVRIEMQTPMGDQLMVMNGDKGWSTTQGITTQMPQPAVEQQLEQRYHDVNFLLRYSGEADFEAAAGDEEEVNGAACRLVMVTYGGQSTRLWIDSDGLIHKFSYQGPNPMSGAEGTFEVFLSEYAERDGRMVPHKQLINFDGQELATVTLEELEFNPTIAEDAFVAPDI
jgi:predicted Zn-dependent peptidase/outer membrane lipoprotein-sorting protein